MKKGEERINSDLLLDRPGSKWAKVALCAMVLVAVLASVYYVKSFLPRHRLGQAVRLAGQAEEKGDHPQAVKIYSAALEFDGLSDQERARLYLFRGNSLLKINIWRDAARDFSQSVRCDPGYAKGYNNLALVLAACPEQDLRDPRQAVDLAQRAIRINPTASHYDTLATALAAEGDFKQAIAAQEKAMELFKENGADTVVIEEAESRLQLYRSAMPYLFGQLESN